MVADILIALLVGIVVAVPVGPVLLLVVQKTICKGRLAGMLTGLGSACIDTLYAAIGLYALSFVEDFVSANSAVLLILGGALVMLLGTYMAFSRPKVTLGDGNSTSSLFNCVLQAGGSALSNPGAIAVMLALLTFMNLDVASLEAPVWAVLAAVFCGELLWWDAVTIMLTRFLKLQERTLVRLSRIAGGAIAVIGVFLIIKGIISL